VFVTVQHNLCFIMQFCLISRNEGIVTHVRFIESFLSGAQDKWFTYCAIFLILIKTKYLCSWKSFWSESGGSPWNFVTSRFSSV